MKDEESSAPEIKRQSIAQRICHSNQLATMLPTLPPQPVDSFPTFASTINSTLVPPPVYSIQAARNPTNETQHAIETLNQAITQVERIEALKLALCTFSHTNVDRHDYEIRLGADKALCLKLGYVVVTSSSSVWEETAYICQSLLQVYQCSSEQRARSFRSIGATELVPLLIQVLMKSLLSVEMRQEEMEVLAMVVQVIRVHSKLESAKVLLVRYNEGIWLGKILQYCSDEAATSSPNNSPLVMELLGLLKDLTFRSPHAEKNILLQLKNGALGRLVGRYCSVDMSLNPRLVEWGTAVIWNLVIDKSICSQIMKKEETQNFPISRALLNTLRFNFQARELKGHGGLLSKIRRNATSAIGNIVAHGEHRKTLLRLSQPAIEGLEIVPTLMRLVEQDPDSVVRRRAMRTLRCLTSADEEEARVSIDGEDMATFLAAIISRNISVDDENDRDMQIQACQTLTAMVDKLEPCDWPRIETALFQRIETTTEAKLIQSACACFAECVKKSPWKRGPSCFSEMFWTRIESAVTSTPESHKAAAALVLELAKVEKEATGPSDRPSSLTNSSVLNVLTVVVSHDGKSNEESRKSALEAIVLLLENDANRRPLAENEVLLTGLVNLCLLQPDEETKATAKQVIIDLVPEM